MRRAVPILLVWAAACGTDPANVAGSYTIAVTDRDNGCNFNNWTSGNSATGIQVTITQQGENATASVEGATGAFLGLALGSNVYTGTVDGHALDLTLLGTRSMSSGNCTYTYNSDIKATLSGDTLTGRVEYRGAGNGNPDCATITGCLSYQDFNGTRPP